LAWKRWVGIAVALVIVAGLVAYGFRPTVVTVETASVGIAPLQVSIEEEGRTRATDRFTVSAPVAGYARRTSLKAGDSVQRGQLLLQMEPLRSAVLDPRSQAEAEARVSGAESAISSARERARAAGADAEYWRGQTARLKQLVSSGDVPAERLERAQTQLQQAEAAVASAEHQVEAARAELRAAQAAVRSWGVGNRTSELVPVVAPVTGKVLSVRRESEGVVQAGEPLIEIAQPRSLEIQVELLSADAVRVQPGTRVLLDRWGGEGTLEGQVRLIEPVGFTKISALGVEEQRVPVIVDIISPREEWERLGIGYRVEARFIISENPQALQVPVSALFRQGEGWAVFVVDEEGIARRRSIKIGRRSGFAAEVSEGLREGETVIVHPDDAIEDGTSVQARN
jgi:HlyD family secretion protein